MTGRKHVHFLVTLFYISLSQSQEFHGESSPERHTLTATAGQLVTISERHLPHDLEFDLDPSQVEYHVTQPLTPEDGHLLLMYAPGMEVHEFTQADIRRMDLVYVPPPPHLVPLERAVNFKFTVSLPRHGPRPPDLGVDEETFSVLLLPLGHREPKFRVPNPVIAVGKNLVVNISRKYFEVEGFGDDNQQMEYMITEGPSHGTLHLLQSDGTSHDLQPEEDVSGSDLVRALAVQYRRDGSSSDTTMSDSIEVLATDSEAEAVTTLTLSFTTENTSSPPSSREELVTLQVNEGERVVLTSDYFSYALSGGGGRSMVTYTLLDSPHYGALTLQGLSGLRPLSHGDAFSQDDANKGRLAYRAIAEVGRAEVIERLPLSINDSSGSRYRPQLLAITVAPTDNQAPVLLVNGELVVREGDSEILPSELLTVMDPDSPPSSLQLVLDAPPSFGHLSTLTGSGGPLTRFSVTSLAEGGVRYVQSVHRGTEPTRDALLLHATDGVNRSPTLRLNISIELVNDEPPEMVTETLEVESIEGTLIRNSSLYVGDFDTPPSQLVLTILQEPQFGEIRKLESPDRPPATGRTLPSGATFIYADVLHELIAFVPTTHVSEDTTDMAVFSVTDGDLSTQAALSFRLTSALREQDDFGPAPETVQLVTIISGGMLELTELQVGTGRRLVLYASPPHDIQIQVRRPGTVEGWVPLLVRQAFTVQDVAQRAVRLVHTSSGITKGKVLPVRLHVEENGHHVKDLVLMVSVRENVAPPVLVINSGVSVMENSSAVISTRQLSASDLDTSPAHLVYTVISSPRWGRLETRGQQVSTWNQIDLEDGRVRYVHQGGGDSASDSFRFSLSDGTSAVSSNFQVAITRGVRSGKIGGKEVPEVSEVRPVQVTSGSRAVITQFTLQVEAPKPELLSFSVAVPPKLGSVQLQALSEKEEEKYTTTNTFSLLDVAEGRVSYLQEAALVRDDYDEILFLLNCRGRPCEYATPDTPIPSDAPITLPIHIRLPESGVPILNINTGIPYLQFDQNNKAIGYLSNKILEVLDDETPARRIIYTVTQPPGFGLLYSSAFPEAPVSVFTQEDVNLGKIYYQLDDELDYTKTKDFFIFEVTGGKSKNLKGNNFYIQWSWISFEEPLHTAFETDGVLRVKVRREGGVSPHSSTVRCRVIPGGKAVSGADKPQNNDFELQYSLIQFDSYEKEKYCVIKLFNDNKFEGAEDFSLELYDASRTLLGATTRTRVTILDNEDQPTLTFKSNLLYVNETDGTLAIDIYRTGDLNSSSSVVCSTQGGSARSSDANALNHADFVSRPSDLMTSIVTFAKGVDLARCLIQIIDDALYEDTEDFYVILSSPSNNSALGANTRLRILIEGPNDVSQVHFSQADHYFLESAGEVDIAVTRSGTDLSHNSSVWCTTQAMTAKSKLDYVPMSQQVVFGHGDIESWCRLTILDDSTMPVLEGPVRLRLLLSSPEGASIVEPSRATVVLDDAPTDTPTLEFSHAQLSIREDGGILRAPVTRSGDVRHAASVKCYSRQRSARAGYDFEDRAKSETSRISFSPGQILNYCEVAIIDDPVLEGEEDFVLRLAEPLFEELDTGQEKLALLGDKSMMRVKITDDEDTPKIFFEKRDLTVNESSHEPFLLKVKILRSGDTSSAASIHVTSRDGSAISGSDYIAVSSTLTFPPEVNDLEFQMTILPGEEEERREESFFLVLDGSAGEPGSDTTLVVTVRSAGVGALVLPAQPVVVSLLHYDNASRGQDENPDPGYPLVCISPCEDRYPHHVRTRELCSSVKFKTIEYFWEVAVPSGLQSIKHAPFKKLTTSTFFAKVNSKVLDSIYYSSNFQVRCGVQPIKLNGRLGIPIKSQVVTIGKSKQFCKNTYIANEHLSTRDQAFDAKLKYVNETSDSHPNTVHIRIEIPHSDGMVPLISTHPLHNVRSLLTDPLYSAHHACSNLLADKGFLITPLPPPVHHTLKPHERDLNLRGIEALRIYRHLDLRTCLWRFDAWFHMTQLVDDCHGKVVSEYKLSEGGAGELSVEVPLHVAYVWARGAQEWAAAEHRTTLHVAVRYSALLWHPGIVTEPKRGAATLQVSRVSANEAGQLVAEFWTQALFRGRFVSWHPSAPRLQSALSAPIPGLGMSLELVWSEPTWDGPRQLWRAVSNVSLTDFSGQYVAMLVPCAAAPGANYIDVEPPRCHAHPPSRLNFNVAFQVPSRPEPAQYALQTNFDITNNPKEFLADPADPQHLKSGDTSWRFGVGERVLGRVSWNPSQDLKQAYRLQLERVLLCAGRDKLSKDTGGCLQPSPALAHRFVLLDRERPDTEDREVRGVSFSARFARDVPEFKDRLEKMPGVDGFEWLVDALYQLGSGHQWFIQVLYRIRATSPNERHRREVLTWHHGTVMRPLLLQESPVPALWNLPPLLALAFLAPLLLAAVTLIAWKLRRKHTYSLDSTSSPAPAH